MENRFSGKNKQKRKNKRRIKRKILDTVNFYYILTFSSSTMYTTLCYFFPDDVLLQKYPHIGCVTVTS